MLGRVSESTSATRRRRGVGHRYVPAFRCSKLSALQSIALGAMARGRPARRGQLEPKISRSVAPLRHGAGAERLVHSPSIGERQRVEIIRCLIIRLLILDERRVSADTAGAQTSYHHPAPSRRRVGRSILFITQTGEFAR